MRLAALGLLASLAAAAKPFPPPPSSYVYNEGVVSAEDAEALGARLRALERRTGRQFVVALFQGLDGESLEDYTNRLFRAWRIGRAQADDGLLFCLFVRERRWRVEVGYGLEPTLTDLEAAEFGGSGAPFFRAGDYAGGVRAVVDGLSARLQDGRGALSARPRAPAADWPGNPRVWIFIFVLLLWLRRFLLGRRTIGRRYYYGDGWGGGFGGGWGGGFGGGGFSGGGGSSGGGGASGGW